MAAEPEFPFRVSNVAGRQVVSGLHPSLRFVDSDETYRDGLGQLRNVRVAQRVEVEDYTYEVAFTIENLTREPKTFSMRAGSLSRTAYLGPGQVRTNLSITAAIG